MHVFHDERWAEIEEDIVLSFLNRAERVEGKRWHAQDVSGRPELVSWELMNTSIFWDLVPPSPGGLITEVNPNLPWAEDHFQERVGGEPLNPAPSEAWWPFAVQGNSVHKEGDKFSHTYPERMWPRHAQRVVRWDGRSAPGDLVWDSGEWWYNDGGGWPNKARGPVTLEKMLKLGGELKDMKGIRYRYGDLDDVRKLLQRDPLTRQAFLPIWFPEDTGAVENQRVPCTLGYHFMIRNYKLHLVYHIRSCDFVRHFRDDVYMAARLMQWMCEQVNTIWEADSTIEYSIKPGSFAMHIASFHFFEGDRTTLRRMAP
jgi:hypothetical protein